MRLKLRQLRVGNNWNQQETAAALNCSLQYYGKVERAEIDGSIEFWRQVQAVFILTDAETWQVMTEPLHERIRQIQNELLPEPIKKG